MTAILIALHATAGAIVVGVLFLQSLAVVMALRLKGESQRDGVRILQRRMHLFIYYPILAVAVGTGFWSALANEVLSQGRWLHWKLVFVVLLTGLGLLTGRFISRERPSRAPAMAVHVLIFMVSGYIIYLAVLRPY